MISETQSCPAMIPHGPRRSRQRRLRRDKLYFYKGLRATFGPPGLPVQGRCVASLETEANAKEWSSTQQQKDQQGEGKGESQTEERQSSPNHKAEHEEKAESSSKKAEHEEKAEKSEDQQGECKGESQTEERLCSPSEDHKAEHDEKA